MPNGAAVYDMDRVTLALDLVPAADQCPVLAGDRDRFLALLAASGLTNPLLRNIGHRKEIDRIGWFSQRRKERKAQLEVSSKKTQKDAK